MRNKSFVVAISGGPDSLALAALTKSLNYEKKIKFYYVLINHNLRKNSKKEANQVKKLLNFYKINLNILTNKKKINRNIQSEARVVRYKLLLNYCKKKKTNVILTAHNLEDQVETFFIRLSRGSGLRGLSSMKQTTSLSKSIKILRPFLDIKKDSLIKISNLIFGKFFIDPSNADPKYLRTRIRSLKSPLEKSGIDYNQIIKSINNLASSSQILESYYSKISNEISKKSKGKILINYIKFKSLNNEIKIEIINQSIKKLRDNYYNLRSKKVMNLIKKFDQDKFTQTSLGGC